MNERKNCLGTWSGGLLGGGFTFCELMAGHDGPHRATAWNGSSWLIVDDEYMRLPRLPDQRPDGPPPV